MKLYDIIDIVKDIKEDLYDAMGEDDTLEYPDYIKSHLEYVKHLIDDVRAERLGDLRTEESKDPEVLKSVDTLDESALALEYLKSWRTDKEKEKKH